MTNLKKIGLTALAASLVTTSAFAGALTVSGGASVSMKNLSGTQDKSTGKSFSMGNQLTFAGSGELDNGLNVALSFILDQGDDKGKTSAADDNAGSPFDSHSVTISSDALGSLKFSGEGGSSAQGAMDAGAAGDIWNTGTGIAEIAGASAGDNSMFYTFPEMMDGVALTASVSPGRAAQNTHTSYGVVYTGVEGLTLKFGQGDSGAPAAEIRSTTMHASYAWGSFTLAAANTEADKNNASDREVDSMQIAYTLTDDMSLTYGEETFETQGSAVDEEVSKLGVSYTSGGMTIGAANVESKGKGNTAGAKSERWQLDLSFAF